MKTLTQTEIDIIKSKPVNEQVIFLLDLINNGQDTLDANKQIISENLQQVFILTVLEIATVSMETAIDAMKNSQIENFTDEEGKKYIENKIINNVVEKMSKI